MDVSSQTNVRQNVQGLRRPPAESVQLLVPFDGDGAFEDQLPLHGTAVLTLVATNEAGETAAWYDDAWWTQQIERWGHDSITIAMAPSPAALIHPVVLHQLEMISRVVPQWHVVGYVYRDDLTTLDAIETLATSAYHEVRFFDIARPGSGERNMRDVKLEQLFADIRRAQLRFDASRPILVRLPAAAAEQFWAIHSNGKAPLLPLACEPEKPT